MATCLQDDLNVMVAKWDEGCRVAHSADPGTWLLYRTCRHATQHHHRDTATAQNGNPDRGLHRPLSIPGYTNDLLACNKKSLEGLAVNGIVLNTRFIDLYPKRDHQHQHGPSWGDVVHAYTTAQPMIVLPGIWQHIC
jgi:hypothetical protein